MSTTMSIVPETIDRIADGAYPALAMLAGMQLDLFAHLEHGPMTGEELVLSQLGFGNYLRNRPKLLLCLPGSADGG